MLGNRFSKYIEQLKSTFDTLFDLFKELLVYTSGDVTEALDWLNQIDEQYKITTAEYGMGDFIQELKDRGYLKEEQEGGVGMVPTAKMEQTIRKTSLEQIFGKLKNQHKVNIKLLSQEQVMKIVQIAEAINTVIHQIRLILLTPLKMHTSITVLMNLKCMMMIL